MGLFWKAVVWRMDVLTWGTTKVRKDCAGGQEPAPCTGFQILIRGANELLAVTRPGVAVSRLSHVKTPIVSAVCSQRCSLDY